MLKLYIANKNYSSWSLRPWLLLSELGIPFEEELVCFEGNLNFDAFKKFAPNAKVPCLYDGELVVWDSLAICEYIAESHGNVWPSNQHAKAWARCVASEMHSGFSALRSICGMSVGVRATLKESPVELLQDMSRINEIWNEGLEKFGGPFLAGENFTAVDAFYAPVVFRIRTFNLKLEGESAEYCNRILSLDSMKRWEEEAIAETARDVDHEAELAEVAIITRDERACS
ncbi:MAG: glutathione S-transferase family protein [Pseudohongiellaceae bacterium]